MSRWMAQWRQIALSGLGGLLMWLGVCALVQAAPAVSLNVKPAQPSLGSVTRFYGVDLTPNVPLSVTFSGPNDFKSQVTVRSDANGRAAFAWPGLADRAPGVYTLTLKGPGLTLSAPFTVTAATQPTLTPYPTSGTPATLFTFISAGFTPGQTGHLILQGPDDLLLSLPVQVGASGGLLTRPAPGAPPTLHAAGLPHGTYTVKVQLNTVDVAQTQLRIGPLPAGCRALLSNPDFELEPDLVGWDTVGAPMVVKSGAFLGERLAVLGGYNNAADGIEQTVSLPPGTALAQLSYWRAMTWNSEPGADNLTVSLLNPDGSTGRVLDRVDHRHLPDVWEQMVVTLPVTMTAQRLNFLGVTDAQGPAAFGIDGAALLACLEAPAVDVGPQTTTAMPFVVNQTVFVGGVLHVDVWVDNAENLYSADVTLTYDPTLLRPRSNQVQVGPLLQAPGAMLVARNQINQEQGVAQLVITRLAPAGAVSGSGVLFSLDFDAIGQGAGPLSISQALIAAPGGGALPIERQSTLIIVRQAPAVIAGRAQLQARSSARGTVIEVSGPVSATTVVNTAGDFRIDNLPAGVYTVRTRRPGWLCAEQRIRLAVGQTMRLPLARLLAGDVNASGAIDLFDLIRVATAYGTPATFDPVTDLDGSGETDINDLVLVAINYDQTCPQAWLPSPAKRRAPPVTPTTPRVTLVPAKPLADGRVPIEVWAEGLSNVAGVDLTLAVEPTRAQIDPVTPFHLAPALDRAFVALNRAQGQAARLAVALPAPATPLTGRVHLATLVVKGNARAVTLGAATWVDGEGKTVGAAKPQPTPGPSKRLDTVDAAPLETPVAPTGWRRGAAGMTR